jgi:hypothetical protein
VKNEYIQYSNVCGFEIGNERMMMLNMENLETNVKLGDTGMHFQPDKGYTGHSKLQTKMFSK